MLFLTVLFINVQATMTQLGQEKERGIKNALSLKGMKKEAFWCTWMVSEGAVLSVSTVIVTVGAKLVGVIEHTSMLHFYGTVWGRAPQHHRYPRWCTVCSARLARDVGSSHGSLL